MTHTYSTCNTGLVGMCLLLSSSSLLCAALLAMVWLVVVWQQSSKEIMCTCCRPLTAKTLLDCLLLHLLQQAVRTFRGG
jgi:hypothetical protein